MTGRVIRLTLALALALVAPALAAQTIVRFAPGVAGRLVRLRAELPGETDVLSGAAVGVEGGLMLGKLVQLEVQYLQGALHPDSGPAGHRDLIEGRASLRAAGSDGCAGRLGRALRRRWRCPASRATSKAGACSPPAPTCRGRSMAVRGARRGSRRGCRSGLAGGRAWRTASIASPSRAGARRSR